MTTLPVETEPYEGIHFSFAMINGEHQGKSLSMTHTGRYLLLHHGDVQHRVDLIQLLADWGTAVSGEDVVVEVEGETNIIGAFLRGARDA